MRVFAQPVTVLRALKRALRMMHYPDGTETRAELSLSPSDEPPYANLNCRLRKEYARHGDSRPCNDNSARRRCTRHGFPRSVYAPYDRSEKSEATFERGGFIARQRGKHDARTWTRPLPSFPPLNARRKQVAAGLFERPIARETPAIQGDPFIPRETAGSGALSNAAQGKKMRAQRYAIASAVEKSSSCLNITIKYKSTCIIK